MRKKKILLICPVFTGLSELFHIPPLSLLQVAALTNGYEIELFDENVEGKIEETRNDLGSFYLVGITVMTSQAPRAYELADMFQELDVPVVMGGMHVTALPGEAIEHANAVVIGEAEGIWPEVLRDLEKGRLQKFYENKKLPSLAGLPIAPRHLLKRGLYTLPRTIHVSRGCPFDCSFCSVSRFFGRRYRFRPIPEVVEEIEQIIENSKVHPGRKVLGGLTWERIGRPEIGFMDDNIFGDKKYARELFQALIPKRIYWGGQASINIARPENEVLLRLAAESGCKILFVGFESLSPQSLEQAHKRINRPGEYKRAVNLFHKYGIAVLGAFVYGFDRDTPELFKKTLNFAEEVKLDGFQAAVLTPLPGTELWEQLESEGRIIQRDWRYYDFTKAVYRPKRISKEELEKGREFAFKNFYSRISILKRFPFVDFRRWFVYVALNYGYRKQVYQRNKI